MASRLPPGEAERRKKERAKATWSGANYQQYDPATQGYGSYEQWASAAAAFVNGDTIEGIETVEAKPAADTNSAGSKPKPKKPVHPDVAALGLDEMPDDVKGLTSAYRKAVMGAFRNHGSSDTAPAYVDSFMKLTQAFDRIKLRRGW